MPDDPDPWHWWLDPAGRLCVQPTRAIDPLLYPGWTYLGPCEDDDPDRM